MKINMFIKTEYNPQEYPELTAFYEFIDGFVNS